MLVGELVGTSSIAFVMVTGIIVVAPIIVGSGPMDVTVVSLLSMVVVIVLSDAAGVVAPEMPSIIEILVVELRVTVAVQPETTFVEIISSVSMAGE